MYIYCNGMYSNIFLASLLCKQTILRAFFHRKMILRKQRLREFYTTVENVILDKLIIL